MRIRNPELDKPATQQTTRPPEPAPEPSVVTGNYLGLVNPAEEQRKRLQKQLMLAVLITVLIGAGALFIYQAKFKK